MGCHKVKFASQQDADFHISKKSKKSQGEYVHAYECRLCGSWHVSALYQNHPLIMINRDLVTKQANLRAQIVILEETARPENKELRKQLRREALIQEYEQDITRLKSQVKDLQKIRDRLIQENHANK